MSTHGGDELLEGGVLTGLMGGVVGPDAPELAFARFDGEEGPSGVGCERGLGGIAVTAVADLGERGGGAYNALGVFEDRAKGLPVGVLVDRGSSQPGDKLSQRSAVAVVVVAGKEAGHALFAEVRVRGDGVAPQQRQHDWAVNLGEGRDCAGPELQLGAPLVGDRHAVADEVLAGRRQRPQSPGGIAGGDQYPECLPVGPRQPGQHQGVKAVALAARRGEPRPVRDDLVGAHRDHGQADIGQQLNQQPVGSHERDQLDIQLHQPPAQRSDGLLVTAKLSALSDPPIAVDDADGVLLLGLFDSREHLTSDLSSPLASGEVRRVLVWGTLETQPPVAAHGKSTERREALGLCWPADLASELRALPWPDGTTEDDQ